MLRRLAAALSPEGDEARRWAEEELGKGKYAEQGPSLLERVGTWLVELLERISFTTDAPRTGSIAAVILIVALAAAGLYLSRLKGGGTVTAAGLILDDHRPTSVLVRDAERAYRSGDYAAACVDYFRASIRALDQAGIIAATPAMTATEAASWATARTGIPFEPGAKLFDSIMYGGGSAARADADAMADLLSRCSDGIRV